MRRTWEFLLNGFKFGVLGLGLLSSLPAFADNTKQPAGIPLGSGWTVLPEFDAAYLRDSNLYRQEDKETSASATVLYPQLGAQYLSADDRYSLKYDGEFGFYDTTDRDNYANNSFAFKAEVNQTGRNRLDFSAGRKESRDPFGTQRTEVDPVSQRDVDQWALSSVDAAYTYGAPTATLNLTLGGDYSSKRYSNNRSLTDYLDYDRAGLQGELRYRVSPVTAALFNLQYHVIRFPNDPESSSTIINPAVLATRDGDEINARVGAQWQPAATLTMRGTVGYFQRNSKSSERTDRKSLDWEAVLNYQPTSYSLFVVEGSHSTEETYLLASSFLDRQRAGGRWQQGWTDRLTTSFGGYYNFYKFVGFDRSDTLLTGSFYLDYDLSGYIGIPRMITARLSYDISNRNSTADGFDFNRNVLGLRLNMAF